MQKRGILAVVSGFSGAGKGTVLKKLMSEHSEYKLSVSATTRKPREGEVDGKDYFFLTKEQFESMIEKDELVEWAEYVSNYYGTPKSYIEEQLTIGNTVILEIEIQGALNIKKKYPEACLIFLAPPGFKDLKDRLINRGTEEIEVINRRLERAKEEAPYISYYDHLIINDNLDECVDEVDRTIKDNITKRTFTNDYINNFVNANIE
ncbi:MAG: guanylate kinase [Lachnospiraceae bacterium]|nr:guanylate kinase [Lachnospiraceae bacterium]